MAKKKAKPTRRAKKPASVAKQPASPFAALFDRWKAGEQLSVLASESNTKRSKLRRAFIQLAGGKPAFRALRDAGAGGSAEPFGGKRGGGRTREQVATDDSKATQLKSSVIVNVADPAIVEHARTSLKDALDRIKRLDSKKDRLEVLALQSEAANCRERIDAAERRIDKKAWRSERFHTASGSTLRLVAPDGSRYVQAGTNERADVIVATDLGTTRWKRENEASAAKREKKEKELLERGKQALKATRQRKHAARKQRKGKTAA